MNTDTKYVSDEVFRSEITRIEQKVDSAVERIELKMDVYTAQMNGRVDKIDAKVSMLTTVAGWAIGILTLVVTIGTIIIPLVKR